MSRTGGNAFLRFGTNEIPLVEVYNAFQDKLIQFAKTVRIDSEEFCKIVSYCATKNLRVKLRCNQSKCLVALVAAHKRTLLSLSLCKRIFSLRLMLY